MRDPYSPPSQSRIQIVGRSCDRCKKKIARKLDGVGCVACEKAYHRECLADPDRCANCGQSMSALEKAAEKAEAAAALQTMRRGRTLVWAAVLPFALLEVAALGLALGAGAMGPILITIARIILGVSLVGMSVKGSRGARRWLALAVCAGLVTSLFNVIDAKAMASFVWGGYVIQCGFALWVFTLSTAAQAYLDSNVARIGSPSR
jgi:hypothetical protein